MTDTATPEPSDPVATGAATDARPARLMRMGRPATPGRRVQTGYPVEHARGTVAELVEIVRADDGDEIWRYTIVAGDDDEFIRAAELRTLVRAG